jgi:TP901 family phage tail tape measure protein
MANQKTNIWIDGTQAGATLKELTKETARLNLEIKNLPRNSEEYRKKVGELKNANSALAEHRSQIRGVANGFDQAKSSAKAMLSQFAPMAIGIGAVTAGIGLFFNAIGSAIRGVIQFDSAMADLKAVTGANDEAMKFYSETAQEYSAKYGESAADIVTAIKLAGSARPELLKNAEAMAKLTEQAIILAKASGDDVPTSIANLTGTLNAFNLPASKAGEVMDILANAAQLGVSEIPYLTEAFGKFGGVASQAGVSIAESAAAVEILGKKIKEPSTAGTNMRGILTKLQVAAQENGRAFIGLSGELDLMGGKVKDVTFLKKTFGEENLLAAQTLIAEREELKKLTGAYGEQGTASEQAKINMATVSEASNRVVESLKNQFLGLQKSSGTLVDVLDFVAKNMSTLIGWLGKVVTAIVIYKTGVAGANVAQKLFGDGTGKMNVNLKQLVTNMKSGSGSASGLGSALKGIGWTALIAAAVEFGKSLYNIASGAELARMRTEEFDKAKTKGTDYAKKYTETVLKGYKEELMAIELKASRNEITEKEAIEQRKKATKASQDDLAAKNNSLYANISLIKSELELARAKRDKLKAQLSYVTSSDAEIIQYAESENAVTRLISAEKSHAAAISEVKLTMDDLSDSQHGNIIASNELVGQSEKEKKAAEKARKAYEDQKNMLDELIKKVNEYTADLSYENRLSQFDEGLNKELFILQKSLEDKYNAEIAQAIELSQIKGKIGLKAAEQYNKLLFLQDSDYEIQSKAIKEKYAQEARSKAYEDQKEQNLSFLLQEESYQDALTEIKVARAQAAYKAVDEKDVEARKIAFENLKQALTEQYDLEKTRKIESLLDQFDAEQISQKELNARKLEAENEYLDQVAALHEENVVKISDIAVERLTSALNLISQGMDVLSKAVELQYKKQVKQFEKQQESEKETLNQKLNSNQISQQQYNERVAQMDKDAEEKKAQLQAEYGRKKKNAAKVQALINGALAITQSFAQLGPIAGAIAAALVAANTALQVSIIDQQDVDQFYEGGISDQSGTRTVRGAKDGKTYRARYIGKHQGGMLPSSPSLILASEKGREYFVPYHLMRDQNVVNHVAAIEAIRTNQMADGGYTNPSAGGATSNPEDLMSIIANNTVVMQRLYEMIPNMGVTIGEKDAEKIVEKANGLRTFRA